MYIPRNGFLSWFDGSNRYRYNTFNAIKSLGQIFTFFNAKGCVVWPPVITM